MGRCVRGDVPLITRLTGGHRWGTHDVVLAPLVAGVLTWVGLHTGRGRYLVVGLLIGLAFRAATLGDNRARTILSNLAVSITGAWWIVGHHLETGMHLPWIVAAGIWVHCAGDLITPEGLPIPILWLHSRRWRFAIPLFRVGHWFETWIITPALTLAVLWLSNRQLGWFHALRAAIPTGLLNDRHT